MLDELFLCPQYVLGQRDKWTGGDSRAYYAVD